MRDFISVTRSLPHQLSLRHGAASGLLWLPRGAGALQSRPGDLPGCDRLSRWAVGAARLLGRGGAGTHSPCSTARAALCLGVSPKQNLESKPKAVRDGAGGKERRSWQRSSEGSEVPVQGHWPWYNTPVQRGRTRASGDTKGQNYREVRCLWGDRVGETIIGW